MANNENVAKVEETTEVKTETTAEIVEIKPDKAKKNVFKKAWNGLKSIGGKTVNAVREHPKAAMTVFTGIGMGLGYVGKMFLDARREALDDEPYETEFIDQEETDELEDEVLDEAEEEASED